MFGLCASGSSWGCIGNDDLASGWCGDCVEYGVLGSDCCGDWA